MRRRPARHVRHRLLRNRRHRRRGADRHRPRAAAEGGAHARPPVRPPAALRQRREGRHQPRDRARRAAQAEDASADRGGRPQVVGRRAPRATSRRACATSRASSIPRRRPTTSRRPTPDTARLAEPGPLPNEPGGELADAAPPSCRVNRRCPASTRSDARDPWPTTPRGRAGDVPLAPHRAAHAPHALAHRGGGRAAVPLPLRQGHLRVPRQAAAAHAARGRHDDRHRRHRHVPRAAQGDPDGVVPDRAAVRAVAGVGVRRARALSPREEARAAGARQQRGVLLHRHVLRVLLRLPGDVQLLRGLHAGRRDDDDRHRQVPVVHPHDVPRLRDHVRGAGRS